MNGLPDVSLMNTLGTRRSSASGTLDEVAWSKSSGVNTLGFAGAAVRSIGPRAAAAGAGAETARLRRLSRPLLLCRGPRMADSGVVAVTLTSGRLSWPLALWAHAGPGSVRAPIASAGKIEGARNRNSHRIR